MTYIKFQLRSTFYSRYPSQATVGLNPRGWQLPEGLIELSIIIEGTSEKIHIIYNSFVPLTAKSSYNLPFYNN